MDLIKLGLAVDSRGVKTGVDELNKLGKAGTRAEAELGKVGSSATKVSRHLKDMGSSAKATAKTVGLVATAVTGAAGAAALYTKRAMDAIDAQAKLARQLDSTIGGLRSLQLASEDAGVATNTINSAMERFSARLGEAQRGTGQARDALDRLGLSAAELAGTDVDRRVAAIADRVQDLGLTGAETADVLRQFGIRNREIVNLMRQGGDAIRDARAEVEDYGLAIDGVDAAAIEAANDAMSRAALITESVRNAVATELSPVILVLAEDFSDAAREAGGLGNAVSDAMRKAALSAGPTLDAMDAMGDVINEAALRTQRSGAAMRGAFLDVAESIMSGPVNALNFLLEQYSRLPGVSDVSPIAQPGWISSLGEASRQAEIDVSNFSAQIMALADGPKPSERIEAFLERVDARMEELKEGAGGASDELDDLDDELDDLNDGLETNTKATTAAAKATDDHAGKLDALRNKLVPGRRETIQYAKDMNTLNLAFAAGKISVSEYLALQGRLAESMASAGDDVLDLADKNTDAADEMTREWERFGNSVDDTFKDAFKGAFDSFDDFADQLKGAFENLLAELAYAAVKNEIRIQLGMQGSGPMQGGISDVFGGGQGGGINPSMLKSGWDTVSGWFTGEGGGISSSFDTGGSMQAVGNAWRAYQGAGSTYAGTFGSELAASSSSGVGAASNSLSNSAYGGLINAGAGYAGSYVGTELGSSITGRTPNSSYGATAGTMIGSIWGPWGSAIGGAIGGFADSLFGSGEKDYDFDFKQGDHYGVFGDRESAFGKFGITDFSDYKRGEQQDQLNDLMTSIAEFDNALADAAIPERVDAMKEAVEGFTHGNPESLFEDRLRAIIGGSGSISSGAILGIEDPEKLSEAFLGALRIESVGQDIAGELLAGAVAEIEKYAGEGENKITGAVVAMTKAAEAAEVLSHGADHLGLQFDATASGAIHAASNLQSMAGGVQNLAAMQDAYYQNFYSASEKATNSFAGVYDALAEVTDKVPETKAEFRDLVEAQNLNTEAGMETYVALMKLAPAWSQMAASLDDVLSLAYQDILGREIDASGYEYYTEQIESGAITLEEAFAQIKNSAEAAAVDLDNLDIDGIFRGVSDNLDQFRQTLIVDQLEGPEEEYSYFKEQAEGTARLAGQLTDPDAIANAANQATQFATRAYGTLDDSQQGEMGGKFLDFVSGLEGQTRESLEDAERRSAAITAESVGKAVEQEMGRIAEAIIESLADSGEKDKAIIDAVQAAMSRNGNRYRPSYSNEVNA